MRNIVLILIATTVIFSCGCMMLIDEATGVWDRQSFSTQERLTMKPDGTFFITDIEGNEKSSGTWGKTGDKYEFIFENNGEKIFAEMSRGRAQLFLTFDNATYIKI